MNILHLTPDFNYSDGRSYYVYLLLKYFKKRGHNVFLLTNGGDSFDRLSESGIPYNADPSLSGKTSFVSSLKKISEKVDSLNIDILHSHHRYFELLANSLKRKRKVKTVFTSLSIVNNRFYVEYKSDKIIAVSNCIRDMLVNKFNVDENKISLIPNFVDSEEYSDRRKAFPDDSFCILSAGRFHRDKNYETLIKAVSFIREHKIKLILIGEGPEKHKYEKLIKQYSVDAELIPPQKDLRKYFDIADICVLSSVRDPLPGFMLQSGLHRKPFIGSDTDGIAEVIDNNTNGLLFEKKNESELSEKIRYFINNRPSALNCGDSLNKLVFERYTEKAVIPQIEDLYLSFNK